MADTRARHLRPGLICALLLAAAAAVASAWLLYARRQSAPRPSYRIGRIEHPALSESSGIVASRRFAGVFWTHNDRGNAPALFAIDRTGRLITEVRIGAKNQDWEDIAIDARGRLYIAQTGNNDGTKTAAFVLRVIEPDPAVRPRGRYRRLPVDRRWELRYPERAFDSEAMFIHGGFAYLITKEPKGRPAVLYRFPLSENDGPVTLQRVGELPIRAPVTGADISADGTYLAVVHTGALEVFQIDGRPERPDLVVRARFVLGWAHDIEGCCFADGGILATSESRDVYLFPFTAGAR